MPLELAEALRAAAGAAGAADLAEWCRGIFTQAVSGRGTLGAFAQGTTHDAGWRAGWAAANRQFRKALERQLAEPIPEAS